MSKLKRAGVAVAFCAVVLESAFAQGGDEIVVTGARLQRFAADVVPSVSLERNADFVLVSYDFVCDTRDRKFREDELSRTLEGLLAGAARRDDSELSTIVEYEDAYDTLYFPKPYTKVAVGDFKPQYGRADTSVQTVIIKTPVGKNDANVESAIGRIESFIDGVKMNGRTIAVSSEEVQLSVVDVERYREDLTAKIIADVKGQRDQIGGGAIELSGLENVVRWERSGPMQLTIYLPYKVTVEID